MFLTLKDAEGLTFHTAYEKLKTILANVCKKHGYLADSHLVDEDDRRIFVRLKAQTPTETDVQNSLLLLTRMMAMHYGKPVILLIDEYDVPLAKANEEKEGGERYYPQMLEVIRGMIGTALKSNEYLKLGVVTGCLPGAAKSIFIDVNTWKTYSVLERPFSSCFGFTEEEVMDLLRAAEREDCMDLVRLWYDGYVFGNTRVFCPWDVVNYVDDLRETPDLKPKSYWRSTSGNGILRELLERFEVAVRYDLEALLSGGTIPKEVSNELTCDRLHETMASPFIKRAPW